MALRAPFESFPGQALVLGLLVLLSYSGSFQAGWHLDDRPAILENSALQAANPGALFAANPARGLTMLSLAANHALAGTAVFGYHLVNVALHIINGALLLWLLRLIFALPLFSERLRPGCEPWLAWLGALVFALHPLQVQAVTYIVQRSEVLCASFMLLALGLYIHSQGGRRRLALIGAIAASLLALLCKEVAAALPLIILAFEACLGAGDGRARGRRVLPWLLLLVLLPVLGVALGYRLTSGEARLAPWQYALSQFPVLWRYIALALLPVGQSIDHDVAAVLRPWELRFLLAFAALVVSAALLWWRRRENPVALFSGLAVIAVLLPSSSVVVLPDLMFEHRFYLALAFLILLFLTELGLWLGRRRDVAPRLLVGVALVLVGGLAVATLQRNSIWRSELSLWHDAVGAGGTARSLTSFALAVQQRQVWRLELEDGQRVYARRGGAGFRVCEELGGPVIEGHRIKRETAPLEVARELYERALERDPEAREAHNNLGMIHVSRGREIRADLRRGMGEGESSFQARALEMLERFEAAERHFKTALRIKADDFVAYNNLGNLYAAYLERFNEAEACFRKVLSLTKTRPMVWVQLGDLLLDRKGAAPEAARCYREYLRSGAVELRERAQRRLQEAERRAQ